MAWLAWWPDGLVGRLLGLVGLMAWWPDGLVGLVGRLLGLVGLTWPGCRLCGVVAVSAAWWPSPWPGKYSGATS